MHKASQFVTLTYGPEHLPFVSTENPLPTLVPRHLQLFLKRLRKAYPLPLRFFAVGEYGDETWRPHYHAALFGFPPCERGNTLTTLTKRYDWAGCCHVCKLVGDTWGSGDVGIRSMDQNAARYLGGYVTKKMTKGDHPSLDGRFPEFSRQSRRPGVGAPIVPAMAKAWSRFEHGGSTDVPGLLTRAGGRKVPMGTYMRRKFREAAGVTEEVKERADYQAWLEQMLPLHEAAKTAQDAVSLRSQIRAAAAPVDERLKFHEQLYRSKKRGSRI